GYVSAKSGQSRTVQHERSHRRPAPLQAATSPRMAQPPSSHPRPKSTPTRTTSTTEPHMTDTERARLHQALARVITQRDWLVAELARCAGTSEDTARIKYLGRV